MTGPRHFVCVLCKHILGPRLTRRASSSSKNRKAASCDGYRQISTTAPPQISDRGFNAGKQSPFNRGRYVTGSNDKAALNTAENRMYDLEPIDLFSLVLLHEDKIALPWPARRIPPPNLPSNLASRPDCSWETSTVGQKEVIRQLIGNLQHYPETARKADLIDLYMYTITKRKMPLSLKKQATRIYVDFMTKMRYWDLLLQLVEDVREDMTLAPDIVALVEDEVFLTFSRLETWDADLKNKLDRLLEQLPRPYSDEALLLIIKRYLISRTTPSIEVIEAINQYIQDRGHLPDISVSNEALAAFIAKGSRSGNPRILPWVYQVVDDCLWGHFDHNRINRESVLLLLRYARDKGEVHRILNVALRAFHRDPEVIKEIEIPFLRAIRRHLPLIPTDPQAYVHSLSELMSFRHRLERRNIVLSDIVLRKLLRYSAFYGSSVAIRFVLSKFKSVLEITNIDLVKTLLPLPNPGAADKITFQHRIHGSPDAWVSNEQLKLILDSLRNHVSSEISLIEYIRALGRCRATAEIWKEWNLLEANGFTFHPVTKKASIPTGSATMSVFISSLAKAGDGWLARKLLKRLRSYKTWQITPRMIAALMQYQNTRQSGGVGWRWDGPLLDVVKLTVRYGVPWNEVVYRINRESITRKWEVERKRTWDRIMEEVQVYMQIVQTGEDLAQAESQLHRLLKGSNDESHV